MANLDDVLTFVKTAQFESISRARCTRPAVEGADVVMVEVL